MLKLNTWAVLSALTIPMLGACGSPKGNSSSDLMGKKSQEKDDGVKSVFNFAEFAMGSQYAEQIKDYVKDGDVVFGDMQKIGVRTNLKVETTGKTRLTSSGASNISARYFVNGAIYPDGVKLSNGTVVTSDEIHLPGGDVIKYPFGKAKSDKEYSVIDIEAKAGIDIRGIEGHVRILGDDKYNFSNKLIIEQQFTRTFLAINYPVVYMINAKAKIGGELNLRAEIVPREDKAIGIRFTPKVSINSTAGIEANPVGFAAGVKGIVTLLETFIVTSASVAYNSAADFSYGDISMDTGEIKALDGKVKIYAEAGLAKLFPDAVNVVFKEVLDHVPFGKKILGFINDWTITWEHTIWDPKPLFTDEIPSRGVIFTNDLSDRTSAECTHIRNELYEAADIMEQEKNSKSGVEAAVAMTAQANLSKLALSISSTCGK
jgi:hypothetical protein